MNNSETANHIIIDCQLLQTTDRSRGMGLYLYSLLTALANTKTTIEWTFLVNEKMPKLSVEDERTLTKLGGNVISLKLLTKKDAALFNEAAPTNRQRIDELLSELNRSETSKTAFFIPAMFSREIYPVFPTHGTANLMLFYDLIPYLYHKQYFYDPEGLERKDYTQRFREFYKADLFAAISQTTADDLAVYLGVNPSRIVSILGAAAERSSVSPVVPKFADELQDGFVLMPSGDDIRKNNETAARAFMSLEANEKLVVTSKFSEASRKALTNLCPDIIFSGSVSEGEYIWLVDNAKAVLFPTQYEGLGMPILEAVERGVKIACSNIPVFTEISSSAFFYFDPLSSVSIAQTLKTILNPDKKLESDWRHKKEQYEFVRTRFSWDKTAKLFLKAIHQCNIAPPKSTLAIFCPSPSSYSAVGKHVFETHAELSRMYNIDYFVEEGQTELKTTRPNILEYAANYYPASSFELSMVKNYDHVLYHIGNSEFHVNTILNALRSPAFAIVHDSRLTGVFDYMQRNGYLTKDRRQYEALIDKVLKSRKSSCLSSIATNQKGIFCNSSYAHSAISEICVNNKTPSIKKIMLPVGVPEVESIRAEVVTVSFAGILSEDKGIGLVSRVSQLENLQIKVFGFGILGDSPLLQDVTPNVEVIKDLTDKEFQDLLRMTDILVNYRVNYNGETSLSTLEAMRYGAVVIVKKIGWFDELPDSTVVKVDTETELLEAVTRLVNQPEECQAIGEQAKKFLSEQDSFNQYAQFIKEGMEL